MNARDTMFALVAACALVACSGDDDTTQPTTVASSAPATVATTAPPTTTDAPPTTTAPPSTPPPTTATPTTAASTVPPSAVPTTVTTPGTGVDPHNEPVAIQMIFAAAEGAWRTLVEALADPASAQKFDALALYRTGDNLARAQAFVREYRDAGHLLIRNEEHPSHVQIDSLSLVIDPVDGFATMRVCEADTDIRVATGAGPDGSDQVVDESLSIVIDEGDYVIADGTWKRIEERNLERREGETVCP